MNRNKPRKFRLGLTRLTVRNLDPEKLAAAGGGNKERSVDWTYCLTDACKNC